MVRSFGHYGQRLLVARINERHPGCHLDSLFQAMSSDDYPTTGTLSLCCRTQFITALYYSAFQGCT